MSDCTGLSTDLDRPELELDFFSPLSQYSTSMSMSEMDISPLPVYTDSFDVAVRQERTPIAKMGAGHGNSANSLPVDEQKKLKQEIRRERNRAAAAKCRQKKLDRISYLQNTADRVRAVNEQLLMCSVQLRREIYELRQCLTEHQRQGCVCDFGLLTVNRN